MFFGIVVELHHVNLEYLLYGWDISKPMSSRSALGTNVLESLACVESHSTIRLHGVKTSDNNVDCIVTELPYRICHLVVKLGCSIEHVLSECCNCSSSDQLIVILECLNQLAGNVYLRQLIVNHGTMPYEQANYWTYSDLNHWRLDLFKHSFQKRHEHAIDQGVANVGVYNDTLKILEGTDLFINCRVVGNWVVHVAKVVLNLAGINVSYNFFAWPRSKLQVAFVEGLLWNSLNLFVAYDRLDSGVWVVNDKLFDSFDGHFHLGWSISVDLEWARVTGVQGSGFWTAVCLRLPREEAWSCGARVGRSIILVLNRANLHSLAYKLLDLTLDLRLA